MANSPSCQETINNVKDEFETSVKPEQLAYVKSKTRYTKMALPTDTLIFRNTVIFYHWQEPSQIICINNIIIAERYKEFFLQMWNESK